jgi:hypothetical protein
MRAILYLPAALCGYWTQSASLKRHASSSQLACRKLVRLKTCWYRALCSSSSPCRKHICILCRIEKRAVSYLHNYGLSNDCQELSLNVWVYRSLNAILAQLKNYLNLIRLRSKIVGCSYIFELKRSSNSKWSGFSGLVVSMLASGTQVRGLKPGWSRVCMPSFGGEVKPSVPCRRFAACKRSLHLPWKSHVVGKIGSAISRPYFFPSLIEVSRVAGRGAPLEMTGETKSGAQRACS